MTLKHLKVFVAVCEQGGVTRAAEALHMVQPAVSTTISELERYYKASLFDRINQRLVLTELGAELLVKAKSILSEFENFEETAISGGDKPRLRIGFSLTLGRTVLPTFIAQMKARIPSLETSFVIDRTALLEGRLECGELDLGVIEGEIRSEHLNRLPFGSDRLIAVCASSDSTPSGITAAELAESPLLLREKGSASRELLDKAMGECRLSVTPFVESISNEALVSLAKAGHGVAVLPEGIVSEAILRGELRELTLSDLSLARTHYIVSRKSKRFNRQAREAMELLKELSSSARDIEKGEQRLLAYTKTMI